MAWRGRQGGGGGKAKTSDAIKPRSKQNFPEFLLGGSGGKLTKNKARRQLHCAPDALDGFGGFALAEHATQQVIALACMEQAFHKHWFLFRGVACGRE